MAEIDVHIPGFFDSFYTEGDTYDDGPHRFRTRIRDLEFCTPSVLVEFLERSCQTAVQVQRARNEPYQARAGNGCCEWGCNASHS